eukprot:scaffold1867_cov177-Ochromonas_danica.AAC.3
MAKSSLKKIVDRKNLFYLYALAICVMNGKQTILWQPGLLLYGVWSFFVATVVCATIYLALTFCLAEMVSIIPFSGGCYGYVRCTLGSTIGFLTGCSEAAKYILFAVLTVYIVGLLFQNVYEFEEHWLPVIWLAFFVAAIAFKAVPLNWSIYVWVGLALMTMITQCIFIFGAAKESNWKHFRKDINPFNTDGDDFLQGLGLAGYLFVGIDSVRTCIDDESNKVVPYVMVVVTLVSIATGLATIISMRAYSMNPLLFATNFFPFSPGITIALPGIKAKFADFFSLPSIVGASLGFFYSGGKQISSMMDSGLLPSLNLCGLKMNKVGVVNGSDAGNHGKSDAAGENKNSSSDVMTPEEVSALAGHSKSTMETIIPLTISGILSYILLVACYYKIDDFLPYIVRTAALLACFEIIFMMGAYLVFATRFGNMDRGFRSPFGMVGALMAIGFWILLFVTNFYYQEPSDRLWEGLALLFFFVVCMVYYVSFASSHQFFSREEQEKFLKAYIVNANKGKKKGRGGAAGKSSSNKSGFGYKMWSNLQAAFGLAASTSHHHGNSSNNPEGIDSSNQVETRSPSAALRSPIKR